MLVALTIDVEDPDAEAHGDPGGIKTILAAMEAERTRATFFLQGRWVEANPDMGRAILAAGHVVGCHSYYHVDVRLLTKAGIEADTLKAHRALEDVMGVDARPWYRLPYGAGADSPRIRRRLGSLGYHHVRDHDIADEGALLDALSTGLATLDAEGSDHAIVLMHSWPMVTLQSMAAVCRTLRERHDTIVTVDELQGHGAAPKPTNGAGARRLAAKVRGGLSRLVAR